MAGRLHGNASDAAKWPLAEYRRLRPRLDVRWPPYAEVAAEATAAGCKARDGGPVRADTIYRAWARIKAEKAGRAARARKPKPAAVGWAPPVVEAGVPAIEGGHMARFRDKLNKRSGRA